MFATGERAAGPFWTYRRIRDASRFTAAADNGGASHDVAMINWPGNDFRGGSLIDRPTAEVLAALSGARNLSLGFLHWLQTEAPRDEGGAGYPELRHRPDAMGVSADAPAPTKLSASRAASAPAIRSASRRSPPPRTRASARSPSPTPSAWAPT
jgi:hypothetical protein